MAPTATPVAPPIEAPVMAPTASPVAPPIESPVMAPTASPVAPPIESPVMAPTAASPIMTPTASPVAPPIESPVMAPTAAPPTPAGPTGGTCCLWSSAEDWPMDSCAPCNQPAPEGSYCAASQYNCEDVCENATWCAKEPAPPADGHCCFFSHTADDWCADCYSAAPMDNWCSQSEDHCYNDCGGDVGTAVRCGDSKQY